MHIARSTLERPDGPAGNQRSHRHVRRPERERRRRHRGRGRIVRRSDRTERRRQDDVHRRNHRLRLDVARNGNIRGSGPPLDEAAPARDEWALPNLPVARAVRRSDRRGQPVGRRRAPAVV